MLLKILLKLKEKFYNDNVDRVAHVYFQLFELISMSGSGLYN